MNKILPYKNRYINYDKDVEVYRCLNRKGKIYSIRQRGVVVAHTDNISLKNCKFIINKAGKKRSIETGQRNVHAYIRGYITDEKIKPLFLVRYDPFSINGFTSLGLEIDNADEVQISNVGIMVRNKP